MSGALLLWVVADDGELDQGAEGVDEVDGEVEVGHLEVAHRGEPARHAHDQRDLRQDRRDRQTRTRRNRLQLN